MQKNQRMKEGTSRANATPPPSCAHLWLTARRWGRSTLGRRCGASASWRRGPSRPSSIGAPPVPLPRPRALLGTGHRASAAVWVVMCSNPQPGSGPGPGPVAGGWVSAIPIRPLASPLVPGCGRRRGTRRTPTSPTAPWTSRRATGPDPPWDHEGDVMLVVGEGREGWLITSPKPFPWQGGTTPRSRATCALGL